MSRSKLTLDKIKNNIEKFGLFIQNEDQVRVHGYKTRLRVYDAQLNKIRTISYGTIRNWIKGGKRAEFDYNLILPTQQTEQQPESGPQSAITDRSTLRWIARARQVPDLANLDEDTLVRLFN